MSTTTEQTTLGLKSEAPATPATEPIVLTAKASSEVKKIIADQVAAGETRQLHLRMRVVGGGCSGFQHKVDLDPVVNEKLDEVFEAHGVAVVVDKRSLMYPGDATVAFHDGLNRRGFSITNPSAKSTSGGRSSVSM